VLISVAVPVPNLDLLTYAVPDGVAPPCVGARVVVPLGTRLVTGIVVEVGVDVASAERRTPNAERRTPNAERRTQRISPPP
jgi:primosomal protein N'